MGGGNRYQKEDVKEYIDSKVEREEVIKSADKQKERYRKMGVSSLLPWEELQKARLGHREEAVEAYQEFLDKLKRELPIIDSNIGFVEAVNKFLEYSARVGKSEWRLGPFMQFQELLLPFFGEGTKIEGYKPSGNRIIH